MFSSRAKMAAMRGLQKPPWHRPMPLPTRRLTPSMERAGTGACIASTISPSVTVSHRQITRPIRGFSAAMAARSRAPAYRKGRGRGCRRNPSRSCRTRPLFRSSATASFARAGAEVRPGDLIPDRLMNPGQPGASSTIKSS